MRLPFHRRDKKKREAERKASEEKKQNGVAAPPQNPLKATNSDAPPTLPPIPDDLNIVENESNVPTQGVSTKEKNDSDFNTSEIIWNRAYDELADENPALVEGYVRVLPKTTNPDADIMGPEGDELVARMKDPHQRQQVMQNAIAAGQKKVEKSAKVTGAVGKVSGFVLKFKGVIDLAVQTNPQAALPWAGACIGLQFLLNPASESQSQLEGIAYVVSRMQWYCALSVNMLNRDNIQPAGTSYEDLLAQLEKRVVALYKALLTYQMKSVCHYYKNQGLVWLRNTISLDDWDGQLEGVKSAEEAVRTDSDTYLKFQSRDTLSAIAKSGQESQNILGNLNLTMQEYVAGHKEEREERKKERQEADDKGAVLGLLAFDKSSDEWDGREGIPRATWESTHQNILKKRVTGTGEWFLSDAAFRAWESPAEDATMLAIIGAESSGKSYLASSIIHHLRRNDPGSDLRRVVGFHFMDKRVNNTGVDILAKSLVWQCAIGDGSYMQSVANASRDLGTIDPKEILPQLLFENDGLKDIKATFYIVINKLGDEGDVVDPEILHLLERVSQSNNRTVRLIFTCTPRTWEKLVGRGISCPKLTISDRNEADILKFIDSRMDSIDALSDPRQPGIRELREKIKKSLHAKTDGDYFKITTALNEIRCSEYVSEIDTILDDAGKGTNDHIQGEIDKINEARTANEIDEINEILLWVSNAQERLSVEKMTAVLQLKNNATSLRSLDQKFRTSYFLFEIDNDGFVELRSSKFLEFIGQRRQIAQDKQRNDKAIHPKEIEVVQHFLKTVCPPDLLEKLDMKQHFQRMITSKNSQVYQEDKDTANAKIVADLLRVLGKEENVYSKVLQGYAARHLMQHLSMIDLALVDRDLKSQMGPALVDLFNDDSCIDKLFGIDGPKPGVPDWMWEYESIEQIQTWMKDSAVVSEFNGELREWVEILFKDPSTALLRRSAIRIAFHCFREPSPRELALAMFKFNLHYLSKELNISTELHSPYLEHIQQVESWSIRELKTTPDALWQVQMALVFQGFNMLSDAESRCLKALEMEPSNWRGLHVLAETVADNDEAIDILNGLLDRLEKDTAWMETHQESLASMAWELGKRHWEAGHFDKAPEAFSKSIKYNPKESERFLEILCKFKEREQWNDVVKLVKELQSLGETHLVAATVQLAMDPKFHDMIFEIAMNTSELDIMDIVYTDGIQYASRNQDWNALIYLKVFQAKTLSELTNPPVHTVKEIMEDVLKIGLHLSEDPTHLLYSVGFILGRIYYSEAIDEISSGVSKTKAGSSLKQKISTITCEQVPDHQLILPPRLYFARYLSFTGRQADAHMAIRNSLQVSLEILTDDDLSNDIWAFYKILKITTLFLDKENTATAYAMEAFGTAEFQLGPKPLVESPEGKPDIVERRLLCSRHCDVCGWRSSTPGGLWVCADCIEINLCNGCREKLHKGEFIKNVCHPSHEGFYVDEWDPERLSKVPMGYVPWGDKNITMESWKNMLREKYLLNG